MPVVDYNRRPASALGVGGINLLAPAPNSNSNWRSSTTRGTGAASVERHDEDYDAEPMDFDAYRQRRFPNAAGGEATERRGGSSSVAAGGGLSSNENQTTGTYASRMSSNMSNSAGGSSTGAPQGRLKSMLRSINTRASTTAATHRTPGIPGGRTSTLSNKTESTPSPNQPPTTRPKSTPPRSINSGTSESATATVTVKPQAILSQSTSGFSGPATSPPVSPGSSSSSSNDSVEVDLAAFQNGIAARKHYRVLESRLDMERERWRKDPKNQYLSDYELNEGAKRIDFEDEEMRALYRELRDYVLRDGKLGQHWERAKGSAGLDGLENAIEGAEQHEDEGELVEGPEDSDGQEPEGHYHDALDEPQGDTIDLNSTEELNEVERPAHARLQALATDVPQAAGPLSSTSSSSRHLLYESSPDSQQYHLPPHTRPTLSHHASTSSVPPYPLSTSTSTATSADRDAVELSPDSDSEADIPIPRGGKFENLALNDTLQLRHQQLQAAPGDTVGQDVNEVPTLPPNAIIYEPPAPKSVKKPKRISPPTAIQSQYSSTSLGRSNAAGGDMGSVAVKAALKASALEKERYQAQMQREAVLQAQVQREREAQQQKEREAQLQAQREAQIQAQREGQRKIAPAGKVRRGPASQQQQGAAQVQPAQSQIQSVQQQKLSRSTGKRRMEDSASGMSVADEKPRPRSRGRGEEEGQEFYGTGTGRSYHHATQSHPPRQQSQSQGYPEQWQQDQYGANGHYNYPPYGQAAPPFDDGPRNTRTPNGLVRSRTMPGGGSMDSGMGLSITGGSEEMAQSSGKDKGQTMRRDESGRTCVTINRTEYQMLEMIGKGGSSKVYRVVSQKNHKQYALKKVAINMMDDEAMRSYATEIQMLKRLSGNDCIVKLIDDELRGKAQGMLFLVMELGETDFAKLLVERQGMPIHLPWITTYFKQMLDAVNVIHEERIVHSDLKPANFVLIKGTLKLIDFGIAKAIANDTTNIQRDAQIGTLNYMSPETMNAAPGDDRLKIGRPSDVWSLGCILYQMVYGSAPFAALNFQQKMIAIAREDHVIAFPEYAVPVVPKEKSSTGKAEKLEEKKVKVPSELTATMQACLMREAKKRPTISQLLAEPWLNGYFAAEHPEVERLAPDEAIISKENIKELINYCLNQYDDAWDKMHPGNMSKVEQLADDILPQLRALKQSHEYLP